MKMSYSTDKNVLPSHCYTRPYSPLVTGPACHPFILAKLQACPTGVSGSLWAASEHILAPRAKRIDTLLLVNGRDFIFFF